MDDKFTKYAAIITISMTIGGALFGLFKWVDDRYSKSYDAAVITYKILTASYTQQLSILNNRLLYLLEFENKNKSEIQATRQQIVSIRKERDKMLTTGHTRYGNSIFVNGDILTDKFTIGK